MPDAVQTCEEFQASVKPFVEKVLADNRQVSSKASDGLAKFRTDFSCTRYTWLSTCRPVQYVTLCHVSRQYVHVNVNVNVIRTVFCSASRISLSLS